MECRVKIGDADESTEEAAKLGGLLPQRTKVQVVQSPGVSVPLDDVDTLGEVCADAAPATPAEKVLTQAGESPATSTEKVLTWTGESLICAARCCCSALGLARRW